MTWDRPFPNTRRSIPKVKRRDPVTGDLKLVPRKSDISRDPIFRRLEQSLDRDEFADILRSAPDERAKRLLAMVTNPKYIKWSLARMAMECGLSYAEVTMIIRAHHLGEGMLRMSAHAPKVMEDVAIDSMSREVTCAACKSHMEDGVASVPVTESVYDTQTKRQVVQQLQDAEGHLRWERCLTCDGLGTLRKVGDADARKLMFDTLKLTGQRGPLVAIQNNNGGAPSMEDTVAGARDVLDVPALKETNS